MVASKEIYARLVAAEDRVYADFQSALVPNIPRERFIGVRTPNLRAIAGEFATHPEIDSFLDMLPHFYYEENAIHGFLIEKIKNYDICLTRLRQFLPHVDNWAVCDQMSPPVLSKYPERTLGFIKELLCASDAYSVRFGILTLMRHYSDGRFLPEYLGMVVELSSDEYYVNMMRAWYFATLLAKQYDATVKIFERGDLDSFTHGKAIQKAIESRRVTYEHKEYLKTLRRK